MHHFKLAPTTIAAANVPPCQYGTRSGRPNECIAPPMEVNNGLFLTFNLTDDDEETVLSNFVLLWKNDARGFGEVRMITMPFEDGIEFWHHSKLDGGKIRLKRSLMLIEKKRNVIVQIKE
jgi:hypothetical protein